MRGPMVGGRWHETVAAALPDGEVLFSSGNEDYSGQVAIVAKLDDGDWLFYAWSYGSCSGCDPWEDEPIENVKEDIRLGAKVMSPQEFYVFLENCQSTKAPWLVGSDPWGYEQFVGLTAPDLLTRVRNELVN